MCKGISCFVPLQGQEEFILRETPVSVHVPRKEYGLLQGFNNVSCSAPLVFSDKGIPRNWYLIHLEPRAPSTLCHAHFSSILLLVAVHELGPLVPRFLDHLLMFWAMLKTNLTFLKRLDWPFLLQVRVSL